MRRLTSAALCSAVLTLVAALALRAATATITVVAVAAIVVLLVWYIQLSATEDSPTLDLIHPGTAISLSVVGRRDWVTLLPLITAQVVGSVVAGLLASAARDYLPEPLAYDANGLVFAAIGGTLVGLVGGWSTLAADGGGPVALTAVPVALGGVMPIALVGAFSPAVLIGLAAAGLIGWTAAAVAAAASLLGATIGAFSVGIFVPDQS